MKEIERKFLADDIPPGLNVLRVERLRQAYIALEDNVEVRVRQQEWRCSLTIKSSGALERVEVELELSPDQFLELWNIADERRLEKVRTVVQVGDVSVEIDAFEGELEGLKLIEVEFASVADSERFEPLPWFGSEVTRDAAYKNRALAVHGPPQGQS